MILIHEVIRMSIDLGQYSVLMLDMNGTFMFGQDRFGSEEDFFSTYSKVGGQQLSANEVAGFISECVALLWAINGDKKRFDDFPTVAEVLRSETLGFDLPDSELDLLEQVVALHELGQVPSEMVDTLRHLSKSHDLILVSNIWSKKGIWVDHLRRVGALNLFEETVFSSDHRCIKPGYRIYEIALGLTQVPLRDIVFIGDDPVCDVSTPKALGMATIHVVGTGESNRHDADRVVKRLSDLVA